MEGRCKNTVGSYICDCDNGFTVQHGICTGILRASFTNEGQFASQLNLYVISNRQLNRICVN